MRVAEVLMVIVGLIGGVLLAWGVRTVAGIPSARAEQSAVTWLKGTMGYTEVSVLAKERIDRLEGYDGPVWVVSARAGVEYGGMASRACFGVVVSANTGAVYGAQGGNVPWIRCQIAAESGV